MLKASKRHRVVMPSLAEDRRITAAAKSDPDAQPLSAEQLKAMVPMRSLRGRPKSAHPKQLVSVRYSPEVLEYFRGTGDGWQSRMDAVLKAYVARRVRSAPHSAALAAAPLLSTAIKTVAAKQRTRRPAAAAEQSTRRNVA